MLNVRLQFFFYLSSFVRLFIDDGIVYELSFSQLIEIGRGEHS